VQMGIRSLVEHYPSALIANSVWEPIAFRVERPQDHIVRPDGDRGTRPVSRRRSSVLVRSTQHVYKAWRSVGRRWLAGIGVSDPLETHGVGAHGNVPDGVLVAREGCPVVCSLA
jgi:hypothetical protein